MKKGKEEFEDPHEIAVSKETDFRAMYNKIPIKLKFLLIFIVDSTVWESFILLKNSSTMNY